MRERESYPAGVPCWVDTVQPDTEAAVAFYGELFGWEFEDRMPADEPGSYYVAQLRGLDVAGVGEPPEPQSSPPVWNTYVAVDSVDDTAARVRQAGGQVIYEPFDVFGAGRSGFFADPAGGQFFAWQAREHIGAQLVNEPGTWNFSECNTRDPDGAARFYGAVFDWKVEAFGMGSEDYTIFMLPGYGDHLMKLNPELRGDLSSTGAPDSFVDAVAILARTTTDEPAHWSVTFAVDDADAIASRAEGLGATVLTPPFDAEPVRMTVIADPQGAVFAASKYQPNVGG